MGWEKPFRIKDPGKPGSKDMEFFIFCMWKISMARCAKHADLVFFEEAPPVKERMEISISPWSKYGV